MKRVLLALPLIFSLSFCGSRLCCVPDQELIEFEGDWKLVRITNGFAQIDLVGEEIGFKETLHIDAFRRTFVRKNDQLPEEKSSVSKRIEGNRDALVLLDENMYHWYHFEEWKGRDHLVLYEKSFVGGILADGSDYYYLKQ